MPEITTAPSIPWAPDDTSWEKMRTAAKASLATTISEVSAVLIHREDEATSTIFVTLPQGSSKRAWPIKGLGFEAQFVPSLGGIYVLHAFNNVMYDESDVNLIIDTMMATEARPSERLARSRQEKDLEKELRSLIK